MLCYIVYNIITMMIIIEVPIMIINILSPSTARSPVFSHLSSSLQGLWTIRAFGAEQRFQKAFDAHQDLHSGQSRHRCPPMSRCSLEHTR